MVVLTILVSDEGLLFLGCPHIMEGPRASLQSLSCKDPHPTHAGSTIMNHQAEASPPNTYLVLLQREDFSQALNMQITELTRLFLLQVLEVMCNEDGGFI